MNMFMLKTKPQWGFLVGLGAVGPAAAWLVLETDPRAARLSWLIALAAIVFGAGSASLLALQQNSTTLWEAARLGAYAWMAVTFVVSFLLFWLNPFLILSLAVTVPFGAAMGTAMGGILHGAGIRVAPPPKVVVHRRKVAHRRRVRVCRVTDLG